MAEDGHLRADPGRCQLYLLTWTIGVGMLQSAGELILPSTSHGDDRHETNAS